MASPAVRSINKSSDTQIKQISQMRAPLATRREPTGAQNRQLKVPYVFEHET